VYRRPYFFEILTVVSFAAIAIRILPLLQPQRWLAAYSLALPFLGAALAGIALRYAVARRQGRDRAYLRVIRSRLWITDSVRLIVFCGFWSFTYACIKLYIPIVHPRLFDQELWNLDARLFFGVSPNVFFVTLFSHPWVLKAIDWTYANVFLASLWIAAVYFLSAPSRPLRLAFMDSNVALWLIGAWLYMLVPSLGPAYRFPDVWLPLAGSLGRTQFLQQTLMTNYQTVIQGRPGTISLLYGVAAFPSLHVGFVTLVWLWMRRSWRLASLVFGAFTILMFIGSVVTGWHYLIDSLAGIALAVACYAGARCELSTVPRR
jgi:PAP2 superfamily